MDLKSATEAARLAWLCNTTTADPRWALRQLHGLADLLVDNRDKLISALALEQGRPSILYERELALLVKDLSRRILDLKNPKSQLSSKNQKLATIATFDPFGVSLIVSNSDNPFRHALAPLAASIAVNNVVILVLSPRSQVIRILQAEMSKYVDCNAVFIVEQGKSAPEWDLFDHVLISGSNEEHIGNPSQIPWNVFSVAESRDLNLILIGDGPLDLRKAAQHILCVSRSSRLLYHGADVVLIHKSHFQALSDAVCTLSVSKHGAENGKTIRPAFHIIDDFKDNTAQEEAIVASRRRGETSLVKINSLDQAIDATRRLSDLNYLAFLNPKSEQESKYIFKWTRASFYSPGKFASIPMSTGRSLQISRPSPQECANKLADSSLRNRIGSDPLTASFSRTRLMMADSEENIVERSVEQVRQGYEKLIRPLVPEPRGGRIDFFDQVKYTLVLAASTLSILGVTGAWYGLKWFRKASIA